MIRINDYSEEFIIEYKKYLEDRFKSINIGKIKIEVIKDNLLEYLYFIHIEKFIYSTKFKAITNEYKLLCDSLPELIKFNEKALCKKAKTNYSKIEKIKNTLFFINRVSTFGDTIENIVKDSFKFKNLLKLLIDDIKNTNEYFYKDIFNYNDLGEWREKIIKELNVDVCPYCGSSFISHFTISGTNSFGAMTEIDHFIPRKKYPLFGLCLYNLIPSCKFCNQNCKNDKTASIIYPFSESFGEHNYFMMNPLDYNVLIHVDNSDKIADKVNESIKLFKINERYSANKRYNKYIFERKNCFSKITIEQLIAFFAESGIFLNEKIINEIIYGSTLDGNDDLLVPMAKLIRDVIKH